MMTTGDDRDLLLAFLATRDEVDDPLAEPEGLRRWLLAQGLIGEADEVTEAEVRTVRRVRAALHSLIDEAGGAEPDPRTSGVLAAVTAEAPLRVVVEPGGTARLEPTAGGVPGALARLAAALYRLGLDGTLARIKVCREAGCPTVFYDTSKNRSRVWCDMAGCGGRNKARAYRARKRAEPAGP